MSELILSEKISQELLEKYKEKLDYKGILNTFVPTYHEKQALMLIFIKVFFG